MNCKGCSRKLTNSLSVERGFGPTCWAKKVAEVQALADELVREFSAKQIDKAMELIEDNALQPTRRAGLYLAISSNGFDTYLVHRNACNCPAGLKSVKCYHRAAVLIRMGLDR